MAQRAYLDERVRKNGNIGYRVRWRLGGTGGFQTETFDVERQALRFRMDVEDAGLGWPQGWIKGIGRVPVAEDRAETHPFEEFALLYLNTRKRTQGDTVQRYQRQVHVLALHFPLVEEVDDQAVANWITAMQAGGSSAKTISNYHGLLFAVLAYAVKKGLRPANPCADTQLPDRRRVLTEVLTALDEAEYAAIRACLHGDVRDLVHTAVGTGLRWGEITALTVSDLTLDGVQPSLRVTKAWKKNATPSAMRLTGEHRYILGPPKSRRSTRTVTLPPPLVDILVRAVAGKSPDQLVFTAPRGGAWRQPDFYRGRWQVAVARARLEGGLAKRPRFHDLRHTHAVWLITAGVPLPVIQARLGHESIQITVDVYGGFLSQAHAAVDVAITAALGGQQIMPRLRVVDGGRDETLPTPAAQEAQGPAASAG